MKKQSAVKTARRQHAAFPRSAQPLFSAITDLIPTLDGWCTPERAVNLASLVVKSKPACTVCLGVWGGRDTFALAMAHRFVGFGKCLAVDPWQATASAVGQTGENRDWWNDQSKHDLVYGRFIADMHRLGLAPWVEVRRARSADVEPPENIGVLIVDANHGPDSIADVDKWAPRVVRSGYVYADDLNWEGGHVIEAVKHLNALGFEKLFDRDTGVFLQRTRGGKKK